MGQKIFCSFLRTRRKTFRSKDENEQKTQPTYDAESGKFTVIQLMCPLIATNRQLIQPIRLCDFIT